MDSQEYVNANFILKKRAFGNWNLNWIIYRETNVSHGFARKKQKQKIKKIWKSKRNETIFFFF